MAGLLRLPGGSRNRSNHGRAGKYYCRISIPQMGRRAKDKLIPLRTEDPKVAAIRRQEVERVEALIKAGVEYTFPWISGSKTAVRRATLGEAVQEYLRTRETEGLRPKTLDTYELALNHFMSVAGKKTPVENIITKDIQAFIRTFKEQHSVTTLNINLRSLKTFFIWAHESRLIPEIPKVKEIQNGRGLPRYLSNEEFDRIQAEATTFLADVFWFYRETGCRLREPFNAVCKGSYLLVPTEYSKAKEERQIPLNHDLARIYKQLMDAGHRPQYYTKQFKRIAEKFGFTGHKFHDLRHTFGVRTWLQTGDILLVSTLMGHRNVTTTQIYTRFLPLRLQTDFPDLAAFIENHTKARADILGMIAYNENKH